MKHELDCKADINTCRICFRINNVLEIHAIDCKNRESCVCPIWRCHEIRSGNSSRKTLPFFLSHPISESNRLVPIIEPSPKVTIDKSVVEKPFFPLILSDTYFSSLGSKSSWFCKEMGPLYTLSSSGFQSSNMSNTKEMLRPTSSRSTTASDNICVVCEQRQRKIILFPCNHLCLCAECNYDLDFNDAFPYRCPVCSNIVQCRKDTVTMQSWV